MKKVIIYKLESRMVVDTKRYPEGTTDEEIKEIELKNAHYWVPDHITMFKKLSSKNWKIVSENLEIQNVVNNIITN